MSDPAPAAPAPVEPVAPVAPAAPAAPTGDTFDWAKQGLDADMLTYVAGKGFKSPADVVTSYRGAEKLLSTSPDQIIKLPQGEFNQENWNTQVADRLGRPKEAAGYELTKLVPTGQDTKFAETAQGKFHELGLTSRQAQELTKWWNGQAGDMTKAQSEATTAKHNAEVSTLKAEWGNKFDANAALVDKAAGEFGMTPEQITALKSTMGPAAAMKFLHTIGSKLGVSDTFIGPDGRQTTFTGGMTPDQAKAEIAALRKDTAFIAKYTGGDAESKRKMTELHARAYPGEQTV